MSNPLRLLALAAVFTICTAAAASGQTVVLKGAPTGDVVEVLVNGAKVGEGTVGALGQVTVSGQMPVNDTGKPEMDSRVYVDVCPKRHIVQIVDRNRPADARPDGCDRREISGVFWIRQRSTVVVDMAGPIPTILLRQGAYDPRALGVRRASPRGLVLFAGGGWGSYGDLRPAGCGDVGECEGKNSGGAWSAGATFWVTRFLAVEGAYLKPHKSTYEGGGTNFRFSHFFDAELFTVSGKLAAPIGPVRLYGKGGAGFHRATSSTTQTNDPLTFTSGGVTFNIPGGTQTLESRTEGWSWLVGGGIEGWVSPRIALYGEVDFTKIEGEPKTGTDLPTDTRAITALVGIRVKVF